MKSGRLKPLGIVKYGLWNGAPVSLMPRPGRNVSSLLLGTLVIAVALMAIVAPVGAQGDEAAAGIERTVTIAAQDTGCPEGKDPCWDLSVMPVLPGDQVTLIADYTKSAQPHNMHVVSPIDMKTDVETGVKQEMKFTIPTNFNAPIEYVCDVHPTTMVGTFVPPSLLGAAGGAHEDVPELGVHFLAYWVGVIAFALLFIVYGATFFLFKYNETPATTDHIDRSKEVNKMEARNATLLAILFAAVATGAIIWLVTKSG